MAQTSTDYREVGRGQEGGSPPWMMQANMLLWISSGMVSGLEKQTFKNLGAWKGSGAATHAYLNSMRGGATTWGAFGPKGAARTATRLGKHASALSLIQSPGGGVLNPRTARAAGTLGIGKQFARLAASRIGKAVYRGLNIGMWAPDIFAGTMGAVSAIRAIGRKGPRQEFGERFFDTQGSYTERQRSIRAITSSRLSTRSAIGNEAALMHR
ncbi:MAG: hypothetical protein DRQ88_12745 [Epsilonproteobacteria bacterium]|nr:MAG: hypothetical protein DRQ88_12745 [Campylobacterota bacterium]